MNGYTIRRHYGRMTAGLLLSVIFSAWGHRSQAADAVATLDQSLSQAMEKNPAIVAAKAKIAMAEAELSSTRLEVARQVIVLWGNWETQKNEAAAARMTLDRFTTLKQHDRSAVAESVLEQARSALVDAEAKLTRTQTELRYLTGQVNLQGTKDAANPADQGSARPGNVFRPPVASAPSERRAPRPRAVAAAAATFQLLNGLTADKIRQVLDQPAELHFQALPLRDVMASLAGKYHLDIRLDRQALDDEGITSDMPMTANINSPTLKAALHALFLDTELAWVVQDGALLITTQERAETMLVTVIYPVLDLLPPPLKEPRKPVVGQGWGWMSSGGAAGAGSFGAVGVMPPNANDPGRGGAAGGTAGRTAKGAELVLGDWDSLIDIVTSTVRPTTWDSVGGPGSIAPFENRGVLIISQTEKVHAEIVDLFEMLRKGAAVGPESASSGIQSDIYRRVSAALEQPVQLSAGKRTLAEVLAILEQNCKIPIQLHRKALEGIGVAPDVMVTAEIKGVPLRSALRLLLHDLALTYTITTESLLVTSQEDADRRLLTVVYPVGDLVTTPGQSASDFDSLIDIITSTVKPTAWDAVGGPGSIAPLEKGNLLAVSQTLEVQEEIGELLKGLRRNPVPKPPVPKP